MTKEKLSPSKDELRICIVAENASTRFGGEAILPVHYFRLLRARGIATWMVVHARTRDEVLQLFGQDAERIFFVPDLWIHKLVFQLSRYLPRRISEATMGLLNQLITQFLQRRLVRKLVREQGINVIHQPIPVAPRFPSMIFGMGAPVVVGPLNGGMDYPAAFRKTESWFTRGMIALGRLFVDAGNWLLPGKRNASVILVANERTRKALPGGLRGQVVTLVENGVDLNVWSTESRAETQSRRFVFVGRLVDWKALDVVIEALRQVPEAELEVIGTGAMMSAWKALTAELGLQERVHFTGWLSQQECAVRMQAAVALVLPSLYECGGAVVLEAMTMGKPVIATAWGGPVDYLDASCGILVEPRSRAALVQGFAEGMRKLLDSPHVADAMGRAGRARAVQEFDWRQKVDEVIAVYRSVMKTRQGRAGRDADCSASIATRQDEPGRA